MTELIVGLDVDTREDALNAVRACGDCKFFKIGSQLFTRCGPDIVREVKALGKEVFLDLKFHDIPNTVARAAKAAADLGVMLFTLHAAGGRRMIEAAREAVEGTQAQILAVTVLTSLSDEMLRAEVGLHETAAEAVPRFAKMAVDSGAHGLVSSPLEIGAVIWVERASQKGIVIGKGGAMLKRVGTRAREKLERLLGAKVFLRLTVKVEERWSERVEALRRLGIAP
jgi:orotidine-5'-phosphate decarboxylase